MITLALKLFLAHVLGDFVLQTDKWAKSKSERKHKSWHLYLHIMVHAITMLVLLRFDFFYWKAFLLVLPSHFIIDVIKTHLDGSINKPTLFWLDQLAHGIFILLAVYLYEPFTFSIQGLFTDETLLFALAIICVTFVSSIIIKQSLSSWGLEAQQTPPEKSKQAGILQYKGPSEKDSLTNAGKYIGYLERLFLFCFILMNQWQAIGFMIAAKSIFRFSDLSTAKDRKLTEYVLIGTLLSFGLALLISLLYKYGLAQLADL
ncbi:DUF3307 domain-containing protein [Parapedobacter sp. ISTM3]|uniref:DUF3307 domain-containing protein n=1 Tax=Parapedobacter luteus TaxID=623280 RepID=A0A1T5ASW9_9SPHI|nr:MULTISPECIES: DUF3307 domain-containing protein [Parapedobacter]MBK1442502.1 DUF3307 domain-containing protein [Parapedobacter sp. ISTM3]SKB37910.1 Protein of unknown function [Parapedobacter luteus]